MSVIVDGVGGAGTKNQPRMRTQMKNEPPRQKMLKTKMTFCVVHGVGTYIFSSYPTLGKQGGNLTLETILRGDFRSLLLIRSYFFYIRYVMFCFMCRSCNDGKGYEAFEYSLCAS